MTAGGAAGVAARPAVVRQGGIDGMRAIAAGFVFVYHGSLLLGMGGFMTRHWGLFGLFGPLGVCIFFVISGYLLFRPFVGPILGDRTMPAVGQFWVRRLLRILPAYWTVLAVLWLFDRITIPSTGDAFTYFGLVQNYRAGYVDGGLDVAWTLVIEMSFYLVLPLFVAVLILITRRARTMHTRYLVALGGAIVWFVAGMALRVWDLWFRVSPLSPRGTWFSESQVTRWLPGYLHWFAGGMVLAVLIEWYRRGHPLPAAVRYLGEHPWLSWAIAFGFLAIDVAADVPVNVYEGKPWQGFVITLCTPLFATFLFLPTVVGTSESLIRRGLSCAPIAWAGLVSYGIYLWHRPIMTWVAEHTSGAGARTGLLWVLGRYVLVLALTLAIAATSYYLVERPFIRLSRRFSGLGARRVVAQPVESTPSA